MKPQIRTNDTNVGVEVYVRNPDLRNLESTSLSADAAAVASTFTVRRGTGFSTGQYITVDYKMEISEILRLHTVTSPTATVLTLASTSAYAHTQDTAVQFIPYNQVEIGTSSDNVTWAVAATVDIQPDKDETVYLHAAGTSATYYRFRFKNSSDTTYSQYSDSVLGSGYTDNTVYEIKRRALELANEKIGENITDEFLNRMLWQARRGVHNILKRWEFRQQYLYDTGAASTGQYSVTTPTDLQDRNTAKNIRNLHIGVQENMIPISKREWDEEMRGIAHTTVSTQLSVGATSAVLTDVGDFEDSGSFKVEGDTVTYTGRNTSTNTLTGIPASGTGSITATHAVGKDVWQGTDFSLPTQFTVFENTIYFNRPISSDYANQNIWMDYYKTLVEYDSDADQLDEPQYDMYVHFLIFVMKKRKNRGEIKLDDDDFVSWRAGLANLIKNEVSMQKLKLYPNIEHLSRNLTNFD